VYIFSPDIITEITQLKRLKVFRFRLKCGGAVLTTCGGFSLKEFCVASDIPLECPEGCTEECPVQIWEKGGNDNG